MGLRVGVGVRVGVRVRARARVRVRVRARVRARARARLRVSRCPRTAAAPTGGNEDGNEEPAAGCAGAR